MRSLYILVLAASVSLLAAQDVQRVSVGGGVQAHKLTESTMPVYPELAKQARIQGTVKLEVVISPEGVVTDIKVISGHPLLVQSALDAVRKYKYSPTMLNGQPVQVATTVEVAFTLEGVSGTPGPMELFTKGKGLSQAAAGNLEQSPKDRVVQAQLLGYYTANRQIAARRQTLAWFVENDPTSVLNSQARSMARGNSLSDPEGYQLLKSMWMNHRSLSTSNLQVVQMAGLFLELADKPQAERLYQMLPNGGEGNLGQLYALAVMGVVGYDDANKAVIDPAEASSAFASHAKSMLLATSSKMMALSALGTLRSTTGSAAKNPELLDYLQTIAPHPTVQFTVPRTER